MGGRFFGETGTLALDLNGARIEGSVFLRRDSDGSKDFEAEGGVDLTGTTIGEDLDCDGGQFCGGPDVLALCANGVICHGSVFLREGFKAVGGVDLSATKIEGDLSCHGGQFVSKGERSALDASRAKIEGSVYLSHGFKADGGASLLVATIEGNLVCTGGQFANKAPELALNANGAKIGGSVLLTEETAVDGKVGFGYATVTYNFQLWGVKSREKAILDLGFAKVGRLLNNQNSWPSKGNLFLGGFVYDQIDDRASPNAEVQLRWLQLQKRDTFLPQPYEQLAAVFRDRGLEEDARQVMIEKNKEHGRHLHLPIWDWRPWTWFDWVSAIFKWSWYRIFGNPLVGFGYRPGRAFGWSLLVIAIGWLFFQLGDDRKLFTPTGDKAYVVEKDGTRRLSKNKSPQISEDYPKFNAFMYSVETFVPLLKLGIGEHWAPNANLGAPLNRGMLVKIGFPRNCGSLLRDYMWVHIILGWVLGTLWIGGLTKLLKT